MDIPWMACPGMLQYHKVRGGILMECQQLPEIWEETRGFLLQRISCLNCRSHSQEFCLPWWDTLCSAFYRRASCTELPHVNLPAGRVAGPLQFQSFYCFSNTASEHQHGGVNLWLCVLVERGSFIELVAILMTVNSYACPLRGTACSVREKYRLEERCFGRKKTSLLAGILCLFWRC